MGDANLIYYLYKNTCMEVAKCNFHAGIAGFF